MKALFLSVLFMLMGTETQVNTRAEGAMFACPNGMHFMAEYGNPKNCVVEYTCDACGNPIFVRYNDEGYIIDIW